MTSDAQDQKLSNLDGFRVKIDTARERAEELRGFSPLAQRTAKRLLNETKDALLTTAIDLEGHC
jgi:2-oxoglutaroyl-CoA hydrolase